MHEAPLAVAANGNRQRFHRAAAARVAVAGYVVVDVTAPETRRAMISVIGARRVVRHVESAVAATERAARLLVGAPMARVVRQE